MNNFDFTYTNLVNKNKLLEKKYDINIINEWIKFIN